MPIKSQQDNARPHCSVDDEEVVRAGSENGWNKKMICQPLNSPDFNVLDLGFFNAIQSLQHESPTNIDELIPTVYKAWDEMTVEKLDNVFITLQKCMELTMLHKGGNDYKLPHMKKRQHNGGMNAKKTRFRFSEAKRVTALTELFNIVCKDLITTEDQVWANLHTVLCHNNPKFEMCSLRLLKDHMLQQVSQCRKYDSEEASESGKERMQTQWG
ncbi:hypothetical protein Zmor_006230 [Zophobas morio]|uniref:Uncharacterized protein n=1 Tax=Zophobas morio TaxID=2755281 RepID=A0AA38MMN4_9CUCU|nr:hypothetical protein Zmor_006230 [Zophobas morio]